MKSVTTNTGAATKAAAVINMHSKDVQHMTKIREFGLAIASKSGELAGLYLTLCQYIRKNRVEAKLVSFELGQLGFRKQRVTEINRVAMAPEKVWLQYEARALGFDKTLAIARIEHKGQAPTLTPVGEQLQHDGAITLADTKTAIAQAVLPARNGRKSKSTTKRDNARRIALAQGLLETLHPHLNFPLEFKKGAYALTITYDPKLDRPAAPSAK